VLGAVQIWLGVKQIRRVGHLGRLASVAENAEVLESISAAIADGISQAQEPWTLSVPGRMRSMSTQDIEAPLKTHIVQLLRDRIPVDRAVILRPGADGFESLSGMPEIEETLLILNGKANKGSEKNDS
jgi:hypothetical protein